MQLADPDLGSPSIKSKEMTYHAPSRTGSEDKRSGYFTLNGLAC
jgi:hypothetical protein